MDMSNKSLAFILVVAIVISLGGTIVSMNRLNQLGFTGRATGTDTGTTNFSLESNVVITFATSNVDFGTGYINGSSVANACVITTNATDGWNNTFAGGTAGACLGNLINDSPFVIRNDGNINANLTLRASDNASTFVTGGGSGYATPLFQWALRDKEAGSCTAIKYNNTWTNVSTTDDQVCTPLNYDDSNDEIYLDILVLIPVDADQTAHTVNIVATGTA